MAAITISLLLISLVGMQFGEMAEANPIHFPKPIVTFYSPLNQTQSTYYTSSTVPLNITVKLYAYSYDSGIELVEWLNYSIDGQTATPITVSYPPSLQSVTLPYVAAYSDMFPRLGKGLHTLVVQGRTNYTLLGYRGTSKTSTNFHEDIQGTTSFYVEANDSCAPTITNLSIQNKTYCTPYLNLAFNLNEDPQIGHSWLGFSLDNKANNTLAGNATLTNLTEGNHSLIVYANDSLGNMGKSDTVFFDVALPPTPSPTLEATLEPAQTASPTPIGEPIMVAYAPQIEVGTVALIAVVAVGILVYFKRRKG